MPRKNGSHVALGWVDEDAVSIRTAPDTSAPYRWALPDLLATRPRRSPFRAGVVVPLLAVCAMAGVYAGATLFWPLYAVPPAVTAATIEDIGGSALYLLSDLSRGVTGEIHYVDAGYNITSLPVLEHLRTADVE